MIDQDLFDPDFPLNRSSEIQLFNITYRIFHTNSNNAIFN